MSYEVCVRDSEENNKTHKEPSSLSDGEEDETMPHARGDATPESTAATEMAGRTKLIYRAFNFLDVAAHYFSSYCGCKLSESQFDIMSSSVHSLRTFFSVACLLRRWVADLIDDYNACGPSVFAQQYNQRGDRSSEKMSIYDLYPCASRMQTILFSNCLSLSAAEYRDDCLERQHCERFESYRTSAHTAHDAHDDGDVSDTDKPNDDPESREHNTDVGIHEDDDDDFTPR